MRRRTEKIQKPDKKKPNEPPPRQIKKEKFLRVAAHIQRCALLAKRSQTELKPELNLAMVRDDKVWLAWLEKHGIERKAEEAEPPPEEASSASTTVAATAAKAEPHDPTEEEEEVQEKGSQEMALTKLACTKIDSDSESERPLPAPTTTREKQIAKAFLKLEKLEAEDQQCGQSLRIPGKIPGKWWTAKKEEKSESEESPQRPSSARATTEPWLGDESEVVAPAATVVKMERVVASGSSPEDLDVFDRHAMEWLRDALPQMLTKRMQNFREKKGLADAFQMADAKERVVLADIVPFCFLTATYPTPAADGEPEMRDVVRKLQHIADLSMRDFLAPGLTFLSLVAKELDCHDVSMFGSRTYGTPLPTSDADNVLVVPSGKSETQFLQDMAALLAQKEAKRFGFEKVSVPQESSRCELDRVETVFRGFAFDLAPAKDKKANFDGCRSSGAMELLRRIMSEKHGVDFWNVIWIFKLICHCARVTQWHGEKKLAQFKAIALQFMAVAWLGAALDGEEPTRPPPPEFVAATAAIAQFRQHYKEWPFTVGLRFLTQCFLNFEFDAYAINITRVGEILFVPREAARCWDTDVVVCLLEFTQNNVAGNVTKASLKEKRTRLSNHLDRAGRLGLKHAVMSAYWDFEHKPDMLQHKKDEYDWTLAVPAEPAVPAAVRGLEAAQVPPAKMPSASTRARPPNAGKSASPRARAPIRGSVGEKPPRPRSPPPPRLPASVGEAPPPPPFPPPPREPPPSSSCEGTPPAKVARLSAAKGGAPDLSAMDSVAVPRFHPSMQCALPGAELMSHKTLGSGFFYVKDGQKDRLVTIIWGTKATGSSDVVLLLPGTTGKWVSAEKFHPSSSQRHAIFGDKIFVIIAAEGEAGNPRQKE